MSGKELRGHAAAVRFVCDGFRAVLAKVEVRSLAVRIGPGAPRTIKTVLLVQLQERQRAADDSRFAPGIMEAGDDGREARRLPLRRTLPQAEQFFRGFSVHVAVRIADITVGLLR